MVAIKSTILRVWDDAPPPVKICCVKFAQRVVLAQTTSNGMEQKVRVLQLCSMRRLVVLTALRSAFRPRCLPLRYPTKSSHIRPPSSRGRGYGPTGPDAGNTTRQQQVRWHKLVAHTCPIANLVFVYSDALLVDATLNTLSVLVRTRPSTSNRILNSVLNFNPLKLANSPMTPKIKVLVKSMEKTTRMLLIHLVKR